VHQVSKKITCCLIGFGCLLSEVTSVDRESARRFKSKEQTSFVYFVFAPPGALVTVLQSDVERKKTNAIAKVLKKLAVDFES